MADGCTETSLLSTVFDEPDKPVVIDNDKASIPHTDMCFSIENEAVDNITVTECVTKYEVHNQCTEEHESSHSDSPNEVDNVFYSEVTTEDVPNSETSVEQNRLSNSPQSATESSTVTGEELSAASEIDRALAARKQPLMELVSSEEGYVRRLRMVKEQYIPIVAIQQRTQNSDPLNSASLGSGLIRDVPPSSQSQQTHPHPPPAVPDDLAARWRIMWGNWLQLYDWHSSFLERLSALVDTEPDQIPKQFIDARSRLRTIYSKYCENHRKAALIAEQYRDYFEELRVHLGDKEDVVSYLMQPVQRIMRYQLPIAEILKYTQRANLPNIVAWKKALDIMKEIPKDTQLILEAARIDGFPGVITALGNILIRGDLLVATTTHEQLLDLVTAYKLTLQDTHPTGPTASLSLASPPSAPTVPTDGGGGGVSSPAHLHTLTPNSPNTAPASSNTGGPSVDSAATVSESTGGDGLPGVGPGNHAAGIFTGNLKFVESRVFLFDQMLVVTEEVKSKRRMGSSDTYAQSTYQFRAAINVNKMRYEAHWYNFSLPNGNTNADAAAVDYLLSIGQGADDLRFAVMDQTPNRSVVYIMDPVKVANREAWVVQLRDIQRMQNEFLLALQDPRRFNTGNRGDSWSNDVNLSTDLRPGTTRNLHSDTGQLISTPPPPPPTLLGGSTLAHQQPQRQRKWPSFTVKRPVRLGSSSGSAARHTAAQSFPEAKFADDGQGQSTRSGQPEAREQPWSKGITRSLSAERGRVDKVIHSADPPCTHSTTPTDSRYRKCSLSADASFKITRVVDDTDSLTSEPSKIVSASKKRNVFSSLFGRNKSKHRSKGQPGSQPATPLGPNPARISPGRNQLSPSPPTPASTSTGVLESKSPELVVPDPRPGEETNDGV